MRLVDELNWLERDRRPVAGLIRRAVPVDQPALRGQGRRRRRCSSAAPTCSSAPAASPDALRAALAELRAAVAAMERARRSSCRRTATGRRDPATRPDRHGARPELPRAGAELRRLPDRAQHRPGRGRRAAQLVRPAARPPARRAWPGTLSAAQERAAAHVEPALGLAAQQRARRGRPRPRRRSSPNLTGVQHSFWVVLGTLSVLRSNALSTGQNVVRGTARHRGRVRRRRGAARPSIGTNTTVLWMLLPLAVLFAGLAPAAISFAAGQAAFTLTLRDPVQHHRSRPAGGSGWCGSRTSRSAAP